MSSRTRVIPRLAPLALAAFSSTAAAQGPGTTYVSREFSVFIGAAQSDVVSREVSLFAGRAQSDAVSREFSLFTGASTFQLDSTTREISVAFVICTNDREPPVLTREPRGSCLRQGLIARFTAEATGPGRIVYLWQVNDPSFPGGWVPLVPGPYPGIGTLAGTAGPIFTVEYPVEGGLNTFRCVISNGCDSVYTDPVSISRCSADYNCDGALNLDDLGDFITDFYTVPAIPSGFQPAAPTYSEFDLGLGVPCDFAGDAPAPYTPDAYRLSGYRVGFSPDASNACPADPSQPFPNLDNLGDYITSYYAAFIAGNC